MNTDYREALVSAGLAMLGRRISDEGWTDTVVERDGDLVFVRISGPDPNDHFLVRIDTSAYPVEPYEIGFIASDAPRADWALLSDRDPRYWPFSAMPGIHGSFNIAYPGAMTTFWCRACTGAYFHYHGHEDRWEPARWPLDTVVTELRTAVQAAKHPRHWRPVARSTLLAVAAQHGITLPKSAGIDND